jgi:hypothetical protein
MVADPTLAAQTAPIVGANGDVQPTLRP